MKSFRRRYSRTIFVFLAGAAFLNMGFVLAEMNTMALTKDSTLIKNLINYGVEEEKEHSSKAGLDDINEIYLSVARNENLQAIFHLAAARREGNEEVDKPLSPYISKFSPPPKALLILS